MADKVVIRFRGVCLYVPENRALTVLYPPTSGKKTCRDRGEHFAVAAVFNGTSFDRSVGFDGRDLAIETGGNDIRFTPKRMLNLKKIVRDPNVRLLTHRTVQGSGGRLAATVRVVGGSAVGERESQADFVTPGHTFTRPVLEVVWTAPDNNSVTIKSSDSGNPAINLVVQPGQTATIGHYDDLNDARSLGISGRQCPDDGAGPLLDEDFHFLYDLLDNFNGTRHLPVGPLSLVSPLTSTCFGGCFGCT